MESLKSLFKAVEIFNELDESEIMDIIRTARTCEVKSGDIIFDTGQTGDAMYLIQDGRVRILQQLPDGSREVLANLEKGQIFGEMAIIDSSPRAARAVAIAPTRLYRIDRADFNLLRANYQPAAYKVIRAIAKVLSRRLRETNQRVISFFEDPERSLKYLKSRRQGIR